MTRFIAAALALACVALAGGADAKPLGKSVSANHHQLIIVCDRQGCRPQTDATAPRHRASVQREDVTFIPNPSGCRRVSLSCACRLAAYWGLGKGLDKVSTWPRRFARVSGPDIGIAAVRRDQHHIIGIVGGSPGAWRVVDFNSGGHRNREYTVTHFRGYFFVDPRTRTAHR